MKKIISLSICVLVFGILSCKKSSSTPTLVVKGAVTTGAHTAAAVSGGYVRLMIPQGPNGGHWIGYSFASNSGVANKATTETNGTYTFTIDSTAVDIPRDYPIFLAVSDAAQTFTMLSELPADTAIEGAELTININPTTTVASMMICPGGVSPPPANTWCYTDPNTPSTDNSSMISIIKNALAGALASLETGTPPNWSTFASGFLNDPTTFNHILDNLTAQGVSVGTATPSTIAANIASLPLVTAPTASDANTGGSGGGSCQLVWDCNNVSGCVAAYGSNTGSIDEPDAATCASACTDLVCSCQGC